MRRTLLTVLGVSALLLAGCTPSATVDLNANLNTGINASLDDEVNGSVNAGLNAGSNRIPPAFIAPPDGGPARITGSEDANIEAELNALNTADLDAEIGNIEAELNAE